MTFTEQDAENDGLIKREAGEQLKSVAARELPELYKHFERVCDSRGRDPKDVLGERVVKALESEAYADKIFNTEIDMRQLQQNEIRMEDVEFVQELADTLGLNKEEEKDPIEQMVMERIKATSSTPLSGFSDTVEENRQMGELKQYMESTQNRLEQLESKIESEREKQQQQETETQEQDGEKSIDDIFGNSDGEQEEAQEQDESSDDEIDMDPVEIDPEPDVEESSEEEEVEDELGDGHAVFGSEEMEEEDE